MSVTLDPELLQAVDTFVHEHPELDPSKVNRGRLAAVVCA